MRQLPRAAQASRKYFYFFIGLVSLVVLMDLAGGVRSVDSKRSAAEAKEKKLHEEYKTLFYDGTAIPPQTATSKELFSSPRRSSDSRGIAPATASTLFLAGVEQFGTGSGQIDLFTVTLGGNTAGSDTFTVGSPATLATTNSTNENKPDINNPADIRFDKSGDLLIANGGTSNADPGSFACVPAGAITTGANSSTTITQAGTNPTHTGNLAYDLRDGSAAIANNAVSSSTQLFEYLLTGSYAAAGAPRNLIASGFGAVSVTEVPNLAAGTYAVALQKGGEEDPAHAGTVGNNKVALFPPTGVETDIADDTTFSIDEPFGLAFDSQNNQLVIANNSTWHRLVSFYNVSPISLVKTINTTFRNTYAATSPDGHVAVAWVKQFGYMQVQVFDNTSARNPVFGPIPYNGTTTSCGTTYIYGNGTTIVNGLRWLSNTKLLVAVESNNSGSPTAKNGFYIYDISNSEVPAGFDDISCAAFAPAPINTGFAHVGTHPFGVAIRSGSFAFADPAGTCSGNAPCFTSINSAISNVSAGGVVNVFGGTYTEAVTLNNSNVTVNIDANATVNSFTLTAGTLNAGGGLCAQAGGPTLTLASGNWTNNGGTFNPGGGTVAFTGSSAQTIGGSNSTIFNSVTVNNANGVTLSKDTTVGGTLTLTNGALGVATNTLTLNGGVSFTGGTITSGATGTVNYNQSSDGQAVAPGTYGNLTFSNFKKTLPNGGTVGIAGTFTPGTASGHTITGSTVEYNGGSAQALPSGFATYNNLTLNNAAGTSGFAGLTVQGLIEVKAGTFTSSSTYNNVQIDNGATLAGTNATTINVSGTWTNNGTFTANGNTVNFNGGSLQTLGGTNATTFNNLTISNGSGVNLGNSETVGSTLTLTSGALGVGTNTLTLNGGTSVGSGSFTSSATGTVNYNQGSNGQNVAPGNYGNLTFSNFTKTLPNGGTVGIAGLFTPGTASGHTITGSTVEYNGSSAQALPSAFTPYNNLTLNNTAGTSGFAGLTVQGLIEVKAGTFTSSSTYNNVQIDSGATLAGVNATTINVGGSWTNNGTFTANGNTVNFNGSSAQTIGGSNQTTFNNLTINNGSGVNLGNSETVGSTLTLTNGALGVGTNTLTLNGGTSVGSGSITSSATGTVSYNQSADGQSVLAANYGNLTFSNFTKTLPNGSTVKIAGTFTTGATGGHTITGSTVEFNGTSAQALPSNFTTYNNLTLNNPAGTTGFAGLTVQGLIRVQQGTFTSSSTYNNVQIDSGATLAGVNATTINVSGGWTNNGTFTANGNTVNFNGSSAQTIGGTTATTFGGLTIANGGSGVSLGQYETVTGLRTLTNDLATTNAFTLSQPLSSTTSGGGDVVGNLTRTNSGVQFPFGSNITFGNPNTLLNFTAAGTRPTSINFRVTKTVPTDAATGGTNTGFPGAVQRTWLITPTGGSGFSATMQLHYSETTDLNGNSETNTGPGPTVSLRMYKYVINNPSTGWQQQDINNNFANTTIDTTSTGNHFVKLVGVTGFSPWTIGGVSPTATTSTVSGRITDDQGNPVEGAVVRLQGTQDRKTITDASGNYTFAEVETNGFYTVTPSSVNYNFAPVTRGFSALGAHTEASFAGTFNGNHLNPLDTTEYFVRQQYVDFLGREPEEKGFNDWTDTINNCASGDASCDRVHVSEMFFRSEEFQQRGYFVYRFYSTAFGQKPDYAAFAPDLGRVSGFLDATQLEAAKTQFANDFVDRPAFALWYNSLSNSAFVDELMHTARVNLSNRQTLIDSLDNKTASRAQVLRQIAESAEAYAKYYNQAFVVMEYFGYLRRDPDLLYLNWISVLDANPADSRHMVEGFVDAAEYRNRFGP